MYIICFRIVSVRRYIYCRVDNQFPFLRTEANTTMIVRVVGGGGAELLHVFPDVWTVYRICHIFFHLVRIFQRVDWYHDKSCANQNKVNFQGRTHLTHQLTSIMNLILIYRKVDSLNPKKTSNVYSSWNMSVQTPSTRASSTARLQRTESHQQTQT